MKVLYFLVLLGFVAVSWGQKPWEPAARSESWWMDRHRQFLASSASLGSRIKIVFLGSSLVEYWGREGKAVWDREYAPLDAINYGIGGDKTQNVLWRIQEGELNGLTPKLVVLYIGSNNIPVNPSNDEIVRGVDTVVTKIHEKVPNANILLVTSFPRADQSDVRGTLLRIQDISNKLRALVSGDTQRKSHFIDLFNSLARPDLSGIIDSLYISDKLHLNQQGYEVWARDMNSTLQALIR